MRKRGSASTPEEIMTWSNDKLAVELYKQARPDWGGSKDPIALIIKKWRKYSADNQLENAEEMIASFAFELVKKQIASVRNRQCSKREEIKRRLKNNGTTM